MIEKIVGWILGSIFVICIVVAAAFTNAFVFVNMWSWFIVPFGISQISYAHAMGLSVLITFLTARRTYYDQSEDEKLKSILIIILFPIFSFIIGYIIHLFM